MWKNAQFIDFVGLRISFKSLHPHLEEDGLNVDFTAFDLFFVAWKIDDFLVPFGSIVLHGR